MDRVLADHLSNCFLSCGDTERALYCASWNLGLDLVLPGSARPV